MQKAINVQLRTIDMEQHLRDVEAFKDVVIQHACEGWLFKDPITCTIVESTRPETLLLYTVVLASEEGLKPILREGDCEKVHRRRLHPQKDEKEGH